ncbi:ATP synthase subunit O, mitochondrial [Lepeophtheirus salmonis]|uniref:Oligomycin sensitivity conferral protein n=2 Tax=Lepeophtheirus salmonis TaxID=72036 RepID=C1BUC3_LEPSM|nr:ATP synthase subunit O, mitochondrial-like [Lepeophtheirus salmonis]ACO12626.1 ATP synthase subunit O, mitochondrial precursor [Lepeophtheirus salmonis]ADD38889.1 ATP synthase subunit O, mitochondrial [Lepeophtheirus salmonis]
MSAVKNLNILTRGLSSSSSRSALVKPPVYVYGTEGRYATALYSAASKQKSLPTVEKDLMGFKVVMDKDLRLKEFLDDPTIKKTLKFEGLSSVCDKLKMNALSKNCMLALAENGRYTNINDVIGSFSTIMAAHRGEVVCEVTTAKKLDAVKTKEVEAAIGKFLKAGQKSLVTYKVDPSILGGMVVSIGDKFVDMSIESKIKKYSEIIHSAA